MSDVQQVEQVEQPTLRARDTAVVVAARWPTILAWFLAGWLARMLLLRLAGHLGNIDAVWGLLVLPLAVLARLVSYVAIFLVVRDAIVPAGVTTRLDGVRRLGGSVLGAILPFFVIYAAWAIIDQDIVAYARSALDQVDIDTLRAGQGPLTVSFGVLSVSMVVVAFALRVLLRRVAERVPRWTEPISVYLEAVWVLVTVLVLRTLLAGVPEWLATRRMLAWALDRLDALRDSVAWVGTLVDGIGPAWSVLSDVVLLPLAWLALAGVVVAGALGEPADDPRSIARLRARLAGLSPRRRRAVLLATEPLVERWDPVRRVAAVVWRAGPVPIAAYVLAFAVVQAIGPWLDRALSLALGPHALAWWNGASGTLSLVVELVFVPLQLALVAGALSHLTELARVSPRGRAATPAGAAGGR